MTWPFWRFSHLTIGVVESKIWLMDSTPLLVNTHTKKKNQVEDRLSKEDLEQEAGYLSAQEFLESSMCEHTLKFSF